MKKLQKMIDACAERVENRWQRLSVRKQRKVVILFFTGYLLITTCVILMVWYDSKSHDMRQKPAIEHISNPLLQKKKTALRAENSSSTILKNREYERK
ncbi:hypothetical protein CLU96_2334 [Chryseobacterium sp. 52]|uniref:nitrogen regulatory IIA protein n=1 Tax=Chryseobacterium sp. 52 TaxID=2035213 RepID=UPI000C17F0E7|nr:nitrogen regulatory IIA protein [Chryseobacterium sp. 52]PIF45332.1 hypothetical protein CLU96_2334 [Chryseobacterium sp. 52]